MIKLLRDKLLPSIRAEGRGHGEGGRKEGGGTNKDGKEGGQGGGDEQRRVKAEDYRLSKAKVMQY